MIDAPSYVPFVPYGRPTGSERLGLGQVAVRPESARALNAPEEGSAKPPFSERQAAVDASLARQQSGDAAQVVKGSRNFAELGARARVAAGGESTGEQDPMPGFSTDSGKGEDQAAASSVMRQRVEVAVRLALPSEEPHRQFSILV